MKSSPRRTRFTGFWWEGVKVKKGWFPSLSNALVVSNSVWFETSTWVEWMLVFLRETLGEALIIFEVTDLVTVGSARIIIGGSFS